jgi:NADH:ubiquinone oxidoreductase subunit K
MIWESPWWMPMAWMIVAAQIGYIGSRFIQRFGVVKGASLTALLGAVNIPFYEEMAFHAHWWQYRDCWMIGHTPLYIIAAELLIGLALGPLAYRTLQTPSYRVAIFCGALGGVSTIIGGLIGYGTVEIVIPLLFALRFAM